MAQDYFEEHPADLAALKRARTQTAKYELADRSHLQHLPAYLRKGLRGLKGAANRAAKAPVAGESWAQDDSLCWGSNHCQQLQSSISRPTGYTCSTC